MNSSDLSFFICKIERKVYCSQGCIEIQGANSGKHSMWSLAHSEGNLKGCRDEEEGPRSFLGCWAQWGPRGLIGCLGNKGPGGGQTLRKLGLLSAVTSRKGSRLGVWHGECGHYGESHSPAWEPLSHHMLARRPGIEK